MKRNRGGGGVDGEQRGGGRVEETKTKKMIKINEFNTNYKIIITKTAFLRSAAIAQSLLNICLNSGLYTVPVPERLHFTSSF